MEFVLFSFLFFFFFWVLFIISYASRFYELRDDCIFDMSLYSVDAKECYNLEPAYLVYIKKL